MNKLFAAVAIVLCSSSLIARANLPISSSAVAQSDQQPVCAAGKCCLGSACFPDLRAQAQVAPSTTTTTTSPATGAAPAAPSIVVAAPEPGNLSNILTAINAALLAAIAGLLGFKKSTAATPAASTAASAAAPTDIVGIVTSLLHTKGAIQDPAARAAIDQALLGVIRSGMPGAAISAVGGLVPGAGPIISMAEPELRALVEQILAQRLANNSGTAAAPAGTVAVPAGQLSGIEALLSDIKAVLPPFPAKTA